MADVDDDVTLKDGSNTDFVAATDYVGGRHYPIAKMAFGANNTATQVSAVDPLPMTVENANANGSAPSANSAPTVMAYDQNVAAFGQGSGELVAASQTDQVLGPTGATGDFLSHVTIVPETTSPGAVSIKDGSGSSMTIFTGGASSVSNLVPFTVTIGWKSTGGAWKLTTGANVHAFGFGRFT